MTLRWAATTDSNQQELMDKVRDIPGTSVFDTHRLGQGFPDFVVGFKGYTLLVEAKTKQGKLTQREKEFEFDCKGAYVIARTIAPIVSWINFINEKCPNATDFLTSVSDRKN